MALEKLECLQDPTLMVRLSPPSSTALSLLFLEDLPKLSPSGVDPAMHLLECPGWAKASSFLCNDPILLGLILVVLVHPIIYEIILLEPFG